jgi:hypothetical protein
VTTKSDNPILWQELNHQQRHVRYVLKRWWWLGPAIIANMIMTVLITMQEPEFRTRELAICFVWIVHIAVVIRALAAGSNAISREHVGLTWDSLVLTGISARQILLGKWRAALRRVAPWMFCLGVIRLIMLPIFLYSVLGFYAWTGAQAYNSYANNNYSNSPYYYNVPELEFTPVGWVPWAAVLAVTASVVLSLLEVLACTMLGIACSALTRRGTFASIVALCVRFAPVAIFLAVTYHDQDVAERLTSGGSYLSRLSYDILKYHPFSLADAGNAALSRLMVPFISWSYDPLTDFSTHRDALIGLFLATALLIFLLAGSYFVAWMSIRHHGALPEER